MSRAQKPARLSPDAFVLQAPPKSRPICETLRALLRAKAPGLREVIKWSFLCYEGRRLVVGVGAFKGFASLAFFRGAELRDPDRLLTHGAGNASTRSVRFKSVEEIPVAKLRRLVQEAVELDARTAGQKLKRLTRPELPIPEELAAALRSAPEEDARFARLAPGCRREYIEWLTAAKRPETRTRRLGLVLAALRAKAK